MTSAFAMRSKIGVGIEGAGIGRFAAVPAVVAMLFLSVCGVARTEDVREATFRELDRIRAEKKVQLEQYFERVHRLADAAGADAFMRKFFMLRGRFEHLRRKSPPPDEAVRAMEQLDDKLREYYLLNYLSFYDILFIDSDGTIFHTVRGESDLGSNLFNGKLKETDLSKRLRNPEDAGKAFVDYRQYDVSGEPSAFFVEPVVDGEKTLGWIVLQCATNKINRIFAFEEELGRTGEVFLVNEQRQMLTDSRFRAKSSILRLHLSAENINAKFEERKGRKIVVDYRGRRALTSFEVCPVMNSEWLLIAKIDEDEALTRHYVEHHDELAPKLVAAAAKSAAATRTYPERPTDALRVDVDEFRRAEDDESLITFGVSTCTAVTVTFPGRFAYMGHASQYDIIYGSGEMDLFGHMLRRVKMFEILPVETRRLEAVVIAPHVKSLAGCVDKLLDAGLFLSQIRFMFRPDARSATVWRPRKQGEVVVEWHDRDDGPDRVVLASTTPTLGDVFKTMIGYDE